MQSVAQKIMTLELPIVINNLGELEALFFVGSGSRSQQIGVSVGREFAEFSEDVSFPAENIVFISKVDDTALEEALIRVEKELKKEFSTRAIKLLLERIKSQ